MSENRNKCPQCESGVPCRGRLDHVIALGRVSADNADYLMPSLSIREGECIRAQFAELEAENARLEKVICAAARLVRLAMQRTGEDHKVGVRLGWRVLQPEVDRMAEKVGEDG